MQTVENTKRKPRTIFKHCALKDRKLGMSFKINITPDFEFTRTSTQTGKSIKEKGQRVKWTMTIKKPSDNYCRKTAVAALNSGAEALSGEFMCGNHDRMDNIVDRINAHVFYMQHKLPKHYRNNLWNLL